MQIEVVVPSMGGSITGGTLVAWLKRPGEAIRRGEDLFTISTDKLDADIPSSVGGVIEELLVTPGSRVLVGEAVAVIRSEPVDQPLPADLRNPARVGSRTGRSTRAATGRQTQAPRPAGLARSHRAGPDEAMRPHPPIEPAMPIIPEADPVDGAVTARDAEQRAPSTPLQRKARGQRDARSADTEGRYLDERREGQPYWAGTDPALRAVSWPPQYMVQTVWQCDWSKVIQATSQMAAEYRQRGISLSLTAFLVQAVVRGLRAYPALNGTFDGGRAVPSTRINIAIGDLVPHENTLPVIAHADELSLLGVARAIDELSERVRTRRVKPEDLDGATFSITNPTASQCLFRVPIVMPPLVAALAAGAIRPGVVADQQSSIRVIPIGYLCLCHDPRAVDPRLAEAFMKAVVGFLEGEEFQKVAGP